VGAPLCASCSDNHSRRQVRQGAQDRGELVGGGLCTPDNSLHNYHIAYLSIYKCLLSTHLRNEIHIHLLCENCLSFLSLSCHSPIFEFAASSSS
jgi:hypothetical protein